MTKKRLILAAIAVILLIVVYSFYKRKYHSPIRNFGSWLNDKMANILLNKPKNLYLSSFKILNRFLINQVKDYNLPFPYIDGLILRATDRIGQVEVEHAARTKGKSNYSLGKLISLWLNMFTSFSILPLRASVLLGIALSIVGLGMGVLTIVEKLLNPALPVGWASIITMISVFGGVQLIAIGLVGEYLGRMFLFINKKPQYIIRDAYPPEE